EIVTSEKAIASVTGHKFQSQNLTAFANQYNGLCDDPKKILAGQLDKLYKQGVSILKSEYWEMNSCPLCEATIEPQQLTKHIEDHQERNKEFLAEIAAFERARSLARQDVDQVTGVVANVDAIKATDLTGLADVKGKAAAIALVIAEVNLILGKQLSV